MVEERGANKGVQTSVQRSQLNAFRLRYSKSQRKKRREGRTGIRTQGKRNQRLLRRYSLSESPKLTNYSIKPVIARLRRHVFIILT